MFLTAFGDCYVDHTCSRKIMVLNWHESFQLNNKESTFGFHTAYTRPERNRTIYTVLDEYDGHADEERIKFNQDSCLHTQLRFAKIDAYFLNALNILGYFPILGLIPCAVRLIVPLMSKDNGMWHEPEDVRKAHFTRGAIEGVGIGICYLIPDIIATVKRFSK